MKSYRKLTILSLVIMGLGVGLMMPFAFSWLEQQKAVAISPTSQPVVTTLPQLSPEVVKGVPRHVSVSSLGISASVNDGYYDNRTGKWTLTEESAFYATIYSPANSEAGNTFIYGHNSEKIFGKLRNIKPGTEVIVTTDNGYKFTYKYLSDEAVRPTDVSTLKYEGKPRLTLQTCSGLWNQTRQMHYFELKDYKKV